MFAQAEWETPGPPPIMHATLQHGIFNAPLCTHNLEANDNVLAPLAGRPVCYLPDCTA